MERAEHVEGAKATEKTLGPTISRSNMAKSENLKRKLQKSLTETPDGTLPHTLGTMSRYNIRLPNWRAKKPEFRSFFRRLLIDDVMQEDLEQLHVINFSRTFQKLYPLKTAGDGNCLLHAVSMAIWGIHDKAMFIRRLLYIALVADEETHGFCRRWEKERKRLDEMLPEGLDLSSGQWATEWRLVVSAAEDLRKTNPREGDLPFEPLEEMHIFVLANVIQRPIIVLSHSRVQSVQGSDMGWNNFGGIYLPILWEHTRCCKTPVVLGYHMGHFTPLVHMETDMHSKHHIVGEFAVPLVNADLIPLPIHFLFDNEERNADELLQKYLHLTEINWTKDNTVQMMLSAKLDHLKIDSKYDLMTDYIHDLERGFYSRQSSPEVAGDRPRSERKVEEKTSPRAERKVQEQISIPEQHRYEGAQEEHRKSPTRTKDRVHSVKHSVREQDLSRVTTWVSQISTSTPPEAERHLTPTGASHCRTPKCAYYGSVEYGGYCYQCFMKSTVERKPSPSKDYEPSLTQERCNFWSCDNMASRHTFPYCHEHAERCLEMPRQEREIVYDPTYEPSLAAERCKFVSCGNMASRRTFPYCHEHAERRFEMPRLERERVHVATPENMYIPSITNTMCKYKDCKHVASINTFPFCHEHKSLRDGALVGASKPQIAGQTQYSTTWYECKHSGCFNIASTKTFPYCHQHVEAGRPSQSEAVAVESLYTSQQPVSDLREKPYPRIACSHTGCHNMVTRDTLPLCHEHHTQHVPTAGSTQHRQLRQTGSLSGCEDLSSQWEDMAAEDDWDRCHSLDNFKTGSSQRCREPGCLLYGPRLSNYYCPEHYVLQHKPSPDSCCCLTVHCSSTGKSQYSGLCSSCFILAGLSEELDPHPTFEELLQDLPADDRGGDDRAVAGECGAAEQDRCIGPSCTNQADPQFSGLCEDCYSLLKTRKKPKALDDDLELPCVREGCDRPGQAHYEYFCQQCYESQNPTGARQEPTTAYEDYLSPAAREAIMPTAVSCCTNRSHSPDTDVFFTRTNTLGKYVPKTDQESQLNMDGYHNRHGVRPVPVALRSIEENARASRKKCKIPTCRNFGNNSKYGFCNDCAARILKSSPTKP